VPCSAAEEALAHPYVAQFHNADEEPAHPSPITVPIDDNHKYSIEEYRNKLYGEIVKRKKELRRKAREREGRDPFRHRCRRRLPATPPPLPAPLLTPAACGAGLLLAIRCRRPCVLMDMLFCSAQVASGRAVPHVFRDDHMTLPTLHVGRKRHWHGTAEASQSLQWCVTCR